VTLIARPWDTSAAASSIVGVCISTIGSVFGAICIVTLRQLGKRIDAVHNILWFHLPVVPLCLLLALIPGVETRAWRMPDGGYTWTMMLLSCFMGIAGQALQYKALTMVEVGRASYMIYAQAILAFLIEWVFWDVTFV
jgi:drug/metabolite transporter (DMT)-like permease